MSLEIVCTVHLKYLDNHIIFIQNSRRKKVQKWSLQECANVIFLTLHHDPSSLPIKEIFWKNDDLKRSSVKQANNTFSAVAEQGGRFVSKQNPGSAISQQHRLHHVVGFVGPKNRAHILHTISSQHSF